MNCTKQKKKTGRVPRFHAVVSDELTFSIDKLILDIVPDASSSSSEKSICDLIESMFRDMYPCQDNEVPAWWHKAYPASSWYRHRWSRNVGYDDSVDVKLCRASRGSLEVSDFPSDMEDDATKTKSVHVATYENTVRIAFNPNKLHSFNHHALLCISALCGLDHCNTYVRRCDLAVDVPNVSPDDFLVASRKRKGKYETTRYFGKSMHDGYMKIYDKTAEAGLDSALTRVEITLDENGTPPFEADKVRYVTRGPEPLPDVGTLTPQQRKYVDAFNRISVYDRDSALEWLETLDYRTQKQLEPYTHGTGIRLIDCNSSSSALLVLLQEYCNLFHCSANVGGVKCSYRQELS